jgi:hypothetical protein
MCKHFTFFQSLPNLQKLDLSQNGLSGPHLQLFLEKVLMTETATNLRLLKRLNLSKHL